MLYYVFSGPLSLRAYVPEIKFNNNNNTGPDLSVTTPDNQTGLPLKFREYTLSPISIERSRAC